MNKGDRGLGGPLSTQYGGPLRFHRPAKKESGTPRGPIAAAQGPPRGPLGAP